MRIDIITLFPEMCEAVMSESIIGRARKNGLIEVNCHQLRDFAFDKHRRVDDAPYGGGMGMLMMAEPIALCYEDICEKTNARPHFIYMSPQGRTLTQDTLKRLCRYDNICLLCGHYEGVDERLLEEYIDEEISIGDYVLTGGELPALVLADSLSRLVPGVLASDECFELESHYNGLLEYPQYTRPQVWHGREVPPVLMSGHHKNIDDFRRTESIKRTASKRPDMLKNAELSEKEIALAKTIIEKNGSDN